MCELPEEILDQIFLHLAPLTTDFLDPTIDETENLKRQTLAQASLASKRCCRLVTPYLYRVLKTRAVGGANSLRRNFYTAILDRSDVALSVQELSVNGWSTRQDIESRRDYEQIGLAWQLQPPPEPLRNKLIAALEALNLPPMLQESWTDELSNGLPDAEISLLLCLCRNLRTLRVQMQYNPDHSFLYEVLKLADPSQGQDQNTLKPLQHVTEVFFTHWDTENAYNLFEFERFMRLPSLRVFRGHMLSCTEEDEPWSTPPQSSVERIYLEHSLMDVGGLRILLRDLPALQTLSMHWGGDVVGDSMLDFPEFGNVLRQYGARLKSLRLSPEEASEFEDDHSHNSPLGNLKQLVSLQMLSVHETALCGGSEVAATSPKWLVNILPTSLRTLKITHAESDEVLDDQVRELMRAKQFRDLSTIRIHRSEGFELDDEFEDWDDGECTMQWIVLRKNDMPIYEELEGDEDGCPCPNCDDGDEPVILFDD